jgi:flagellar biosynthesis protein FliP
VLASVCLITGTIWLLYTSIALGTLGLFLLIDGYTLLVPLPFF